MAKVWERTWTTASGEEKSAWVADYFDAKSKRHIKTFRRKKDADSYLLSVRTEVGKGVHTPPNRSITVAEAATDWIAYVKGERRERSTTDQYDQHVRLHIHPRIGNVKLANLTAPMVENFRDAIVRDMSRPMARKVLGSLKMLLRDAKRRGHVAQNAAADTTIKASKREKRKLKVGVDFPTSDEVRRMIDAGQERSRALLMVAAFAGLRSSELRGLRWADVNWKQGKLTVHQRADRWGVIDVPKSEAGERTIPVMPIVINALRAAKLKGNKGEHVFANGAGNIENHANLVQRVLQQVQIKAGVTVPDVDAGKPKAKYGGLHSLRHYFAAWSLTRPDNGGLGLTLKELQERLGHATLAMTADTYGHLLPPSEEKERQRMADAQAAMFGAV